MCIATLKNHKSEWLTTETVWPEQDNFYKNRFSHISCPNSYRCGHISWGLPFLTRKQPGNQELIGWLLGMSEFVLSGVSRVAISALPHHFQDYSIFLLFWSIKSTFSTLIKCYLSANLTCILLQAVGPVIELIMPMKTWKYETALKEISLMHLSFTLKAFLTSSSTWKASQGALSADDDDL